MNSAHVTKAVVLAGGRGTRLGALTDNTPKPLLPVGGKPFLEYVIWNLVRWGIRDIVLSTGYCAAAIRDHFGDGKSSGACITYAEEDFPLGTGGGVRFAAVNMTVPFFVLNGDTLLDCDFQLLAQHMVNCKAKAGIILREEENAGRFGTVDFSNGYIRGFHEKSSTGRGVINGGVYVLTPAAVELVPPGVSSLEMELFPHLAAEGALVGSVCNGFFIDMGLPSTYSTAQQLLPEWEKNTMAKAVVPDCTGALIT